VIYKQQALSFKASPALDLTTQVIFKLENLLPFEETVSVDLIASLFIQQAQRFEASPTDQLRGLYDALLEFKKNPMLVKLKGKTCGLTLRTAPLSDLTMLESMLATFLPISKSLSGDKKDAKKSSSGVGRDQIEVLLEIRATSLDVNPCLTKEIYDRTQLDEFETVELTQSDMRGMGMAIGVPEKDLKIYR